MALLERDLVIAPGNEAPVEGAKRAELLGRIEALLRDLERLRTEPEGASRPHLVGTDGTELELPIHVYEVLLCVARQMVNGEGVVFAPLHKQLTTRQAAQILNISRPYLVRLLDQGAIPFTMVGTHRRVELKDVLRYRKERDKRTGKLIEEMAEEKEWGL